MRGLECGAINWIDAIGHETFGDSANVTLRADVQVLDPRFYRLLLFGGSVGAAEAYFRGYWKSSDLVALLRVFCRNNEALRGLQRGQNWLARPLQKFAHWRNRNTQKGSIQNIAAHYDLGNDFFEQFLGSTMSYSCGLFERQNATLERASIAKYEQVCRALRLSARDRLLEIGCGWGGLAFYAARNFGCRVTAVTISREQAEYASREVQRQGLERLVSIQLQDYRGIQGQFDKLVSIEMIEAVGHEFLPSYFRTSSKLLKSGGMMFLQSITMPDERHARYRKSVDVIQRYIFPGGCLPCLATIRDAATEVGALRVAKVDDLGEHYAQTISHWRQRFQQNLDSIRALGYSERLLRAWEFYLCYSEAGFREQQIGLTQIMLQKSDR
jgi:cyclopropane-fatty-acyl-phospholipid synthase